MVEAKFDPGLDHLLALDGVVLVVDPVGNHWVKFVGKRVEPSSERPHGLSYSLTLHAADGERLVGFDNAHAIHSGSGPSRRASVTYDHRHRRHRDARPYEFQDAAALLRDFWTEVDALLKKEGVLR
jgi:Family of unknown function (DUF6516)